METRWLEIGDRVFVRRYRFYDQGIVAVLGGDTALVVDTRTTPAQAREVLDDLRDLGSPRVGIVVNTHGHYDHVFGNAVFRPAVIWGHERCRTMIELTGAAQRERVTRDVPALADDLAEVVLDPPDRVFTDAATLDLGGREIRLAYLGRGHTDNDIVVSIPDADVLCAGDLLENGAPPWFGDGYPLDWPATTERILALTGRAHGRQPGARRSRRARVRGGVAGAVPVHRSVGVPGARRRPRPRGGAGCRAVARRAVARTPGAGACAAPGRAGQVSPSATPARAVTKPGRAVTHVGVKAKMLEQR